MSEELKYMFVIGRYSKEVDKDLYLSTDSVSWTDEKEKVQFYDELDDAYRWLVQLYPYASIKYARDCIFKK